MQHGYGYVSLDLFLNVMVAFNYEASGPEYTRVDVGSYQSCQ